MDFVKQYFGEVRHIAEQLGKNHSQEICSMIENLKNTRQLGGRVFVLGVGGSAGNASHMVNDLRKLCEIEAYCPTDNVSELSARTNDEGFETFFEEYLKISKLDCDDILFVLSVGGGNLEKNVSVGLINAIQYAIDCYATVLSITGKAEGFAQEHSHVNLTIPNASFDRITPHSEAFQAIVWHCIVSSPELQINKTKW